MCHIYHVRLIPHLLPVEGRHQSAMFARLPLGQVPPLTAAIPDVLGQLALTALGLRPWQWFHLCCP